MNNKVLITGISGWIAKHTAIQLLIQQIIKVQFWEQLRLVVVTVLGLISLELILPL